MWELDLADQANGLHCRIGHRCRAEIPELSVVVLFPDAETKVPNLAGLSAESENHHLQAI